MPRACSALPEYGQTDGSGTPASVRFVSQTDTSGGFDPTHYWWSNPESQVLASGAFKLSAQVLPGQWSDWNGKVGTDPVAAAGFADAAAHVTSIGFSFGGGCFFENGVGTTDGSGTFELDRFTVS